ncbi:MAG TPA: hypothetical protein VFS71_12535 [Flavobacterium sp.]|uniref:hypothetical protein n=1 Tax=Flavobacterium sp. TaxID=239 RepID=UPI002DBA0CEF|nr:hypothetical protein [Flavobacterium sp.]HEU4790509.1 hypothetical protein [Flavobacterium sp.]
MRANNFIKTTITKYKAKKKNNLRIVTPKANIFVKHLSKNNTYLNSIIISIGLMTSLILLGIANYFNSFDWRVSCIPLMISFILTSLLTALKYRFKKI